MFSGSGSVGARVEAAAGVGATAFGANRWWGRRTTLLALSDLSLKHRTSMVARRICFTAVDGSDEVYFCISALSAGQLCLNAQTTTKTLRHLAWDPAAYEDLTAGRYLGGLGSVHPLQMEPDLWQGRLGPALVYTRQAKVTRKFMPLSYVWTSFVSHPRSNLRSIKATGMADRAKKVWNEMFCSFRCTMHMSRALESWNYLDLVGC